MGTSAMSRVGRSWQASLTPGAACTRSSTACSAALGTGSPTTSPRTRMRQVEQRPRPPHTCACGILLMRLASSTLKPRATRIVRSGYMQAPEPTATSAGRLAEQRQRRQKHRERKQQFFHARVERLEPEPEMDPEAAVNPNDQQQNRLQRASKGAKAQKFASTCAY